MRAMGAPKLVEFLLARYDEDESAARAAGGDDWRVDDDNHLALPMVKMPNLSGFRHIAPGAVYETAGSNTAQTEHIARHDPARVLAQCAAMRRIIDEAFSLASLIDGEWGCGHGSEEIRTGVIPASPHKGSHFLPPYCDGIDVAKGFLVPLAAVYADHPDYRPEWKP